MRVANSVCFGKYKTEKTNLNPKGEIDMWMTASGYSINILCRGVEVHAVYSYMQVSHPCTCVWRSEVNTDVFLCCYLPSINLYFRCMSVLHTYTHVYQMHA